MIDFGRLHIENLMDICAVANSPMYIYKHFCADMSVQSLAQNGANELVKTANEILSEQEIHLEQLAKVYSVLIALNYVDALSIIRALEELPMPQVRWANELIKIIQSKKVGNVFQVEHVNARPYLIGSQQLITSNNERDAKLDRSPQILHPSGLDIANSIITY